jgi:transcriptional regulator with GAF, ATPase, and Fis domain
VRELQNVVERAVLRCTDGVLRLAELLVKRSPEAAPVGGKAEALRPTLDELQRDYIRQVLRECSGQIAGPGGAAEVLGLHPNTLRSRMHKLGIDAEVSSRPSRKAELEH